MLYNLKAEMVRHGVSRKDISIEIKKTVKSVNDKIAGRSQFTINEAWKIKNRFFPALELEYLFADMQAGQVQAG